MPTGTGPSSPGRSRRPARGDVLVVVRLDRLARSVRHLLEVIDALRSKGAAFRSLGDPVDTSTPQGVFTIQILGAVAELERQLIASRTKAGIAAAVARGSRPGNPGLRAKDPRAITKIARARREGHTGRVVATVDAWLPTVRRLRPKTSWGEIVKELNKDSANTGGPWNVERLKRSMGHDLSCEIGASREAGTHICEKGVLFELQSCRRQVGSGEVLTTGAGARAPAALAGRVRPRLVALPAGGRLRRRNRPPRWPMVETSPRSGRLPTPMLERAGERPREPVCRHGISAMQPEWLRLCFHGG